jgi:hypothetical protein
MNLYDVAYTERGHVVWSVQPWDWRTSQVSPLESRLRGNVRSLFSCKLFTHRPANILQCYSKAPIIWVQFELASCTTARPGTRGFCCARTMNTSLGLCMNVTYHTSCVKCPILLLDFNEIWSLWTLFCGGSYVNFRGNSSSGSRVPYGQTYMGKLTVAFCYFANARYDKLMEI